MSDAELSLMVEGARIGFDDANKGLSKWSDNRTTQNSFVVGYHYAFEAHNDGVSLDEIIQKINEQGLGLVAPS